MSIQKLKDDIKSANIAPVYAFYGKEGYLRRYYLDLLINKTIDKQSSKFNLHVVEGKEFSIDGFCCDVESYPVFGKHKIIIIKNLLPTQLTSALSKQIAAAVYDIPNGVTVVFDYDETCEIENKHAIVKSMFKACSAVEVEFKPPSKDELSTWVKRHINAHKKNIENADVQYILSVCDNDMISLTNEIEKICLYTQDDLVTKKHIDAIAAKSVESRVYDLTDAIGQKRYDQAMNILNELFSQRIEPVYILSAISSNIITLMKVKIAKQSRLTDCEIIKAAAISHPYLLNKFTRLEPNFSNEFLNFALKSCSKADIDLKSSRMEKEYILELLIATITAYDDAARRIK